MKIYRLIAAAACGALILAGCGNGASEQGSKQTSETSAASSAEAGSTSDASDTSEASQSGETEYDNSNVSGEDYAEDVLPVFSGEYTYDDCLKLGNYIGIELTETAQEVTDEDVESYLKSQTAAETVEDADAQAENGDTVNIAYVGEKDGVAFEGGTSDGYDLVLGSGSFIPGFEDGVVGMKVGEKKDLNLTFPENYGAEYLAGADVVFHVTLNEIKRAPELTDEWVAETYEGQFDTLEELKNYTKEYLETNAKTAAEQQMRQDAWLAVYNSTEFYKLPEDLVKEGEEEFDKQYEAAAQQFGMTLEEYLEYSGLKEEDLEKEKEQYSQSVAKNILIMDAIWEAKNMTEDEEYDKIIDNVAAANGYSTEDFLAQNDAKAVEQYAKTQKILGFIVDNAKITK